MDALVRGLQEHGHRNVMALPDAGALAGMINSLTHPGDMVVCLGAGNITTWANALPNELAALPAPMGAAE